MNSTVFLAAAALALLVRPPAGGIAWQSGWDETLARAASEKKVVFLAVNMDGERANDRLATKVYADKALAKLAEHTLNMVASAAEHAALDKPCPRFDGLKCQDHRRIDTGARTEVLKGDAEGYVIAPQHVWLAPDKKVLVSVPYEVSADELAWCFVTALRAVDEASAPAMPVTARMPARAILGGVVDPSGAGAGGSLVPPTSDEVDALITQLKRGATGEERIGALRRLILSDDPDAIEYIGLELKSGGDRGGGMGGGMGGGGGKGGGGGGGGGYGGAGGGQEKQRLILRAIGLLGPPAYWELAAEYVERSEADLFREAVVALEQLGAPEALPALSKALSREKDVSREKDLLRALGACGAKDKRTREMLVKRATKEKQILLRTNALIALAWSASDPEVAALLRTTLEKGDDTDRAAAALAAGIARERALLPALTAAAAAAQSEDAKKCVAAAQAVLEGGGLELLREHVTKVAGDEIVRERIFGTVGKAAAGLGR